MNLAIAIIGAAAAVAAGVAAVGSWRAAGRSNATAAAVAGIERDRRHSELTPRFRIEWGQANPGVETLTLRVTLAGPPGLDFVDRLTVRIRDDHFRRSDHEPLAGGPSREDIARQIWGPYRFTPGTGPDEARADETGRVTVYDHVLPVGEGLPFQLDPTYPPRWSAWTREGWLAQVGTVIRLVLVAERDGHGSWTLPAEIDAAGPEMMLEVP